MSNKIQIKRSTSNAAVTGLANGELAFTQASNTLWIGLPDGSGTASIGGVRNPGTLTANQALVTNSTSGIDKIIVANVVPQQIHANGGFGSAGYVLVSAGSTGNVYWESASAVGGVNTDAQYTFSNTITFNGTVNSNNIYSTATVNASTLSVGGWVVANQSGVFASGGVNGSVISVGSQFFANTTEVFLSQGMKLAANGSLGSANQVLRTDSSGTAYWSSDAGDISAVTAGDGLTGGGSGGDVTLDVGAGNGIEVNATAVAVKAGNGIASNSTGVHVVAGNSGVISNTSGVYVNAATFSIANSQISGTIDINNQTNGSYVSNIFSGNGVDVSVTSGHAAQPYISVVANNGIVSNSTGVFAKAANGISVDGSGINVVGGDGLVSNSSGVHVGAGNGVSVSADAVAVNGGSTLTVNTSGVHVNSTLSLTDLTLAGNLTINGTLTTVDTTNLVVNDSIISLARNNGADSLDIGWYGQYNDGTERFTGLIWDTSADVYELFANTTSEPTTTLDIGGTGFTHATLKAFLDTGAFVANSSNVQITANSTVSVNITANTITLSSPLAGTSGGTGLASYTLEDILVANSSNGFRKLGLGTDGYVLQSKGGALVYDSLDGGTF